ncbi:MULTISPECIES: SMP-30/gluconolactonase/LRE family protein [unclassified Rhodococcus (in: high G+C Gram-positive bacteria)]|uniref:SMP-30/gluconolactonase/LRE family protein n=1 Tax=unclassified Rhodococcus (in: high G+C Gram-positive bacteria) TaxID=192944 RepID=UPI0015C5BD41|nr:MULTISPECIES: SMP-30/gluconolactonase/LRE family protein [unclassified Rhodococcus (in: high G+C Gram-positive bacteria)]
MSDDLTVLLEKLRFPEGSRWREGRLWFSDMHTGEVYSVDPVNGDAQVFTTLKGQPSGLGWLPDGDLLISSMLDNRVVRVDSEGRQSTWADLSDLTDLPTNEMVVTQDGHVYLTGFGFDLYNDAPKAGGPLFHISPTGIASVAADGFIFPNGSVVIPGTRTLVVAETWGEKLTAFDIEDDGTLTNRHTWAELWPGATADGTCVDNEGGIWISSILEHKFVRVVEGGAVTDTIDVGDAFAVDCVLGGVDGRTLYLSTSDSWQPAETELSWAGRVLTTRVAVPGPTT